MQCSAVCCIVFHFIPALRSTLTDTYWWRDTNTLDLFASKSCNAHKSREEILRETERAIAPRKRGSWGRTTVTIILNFSTLIYLRNTFIPSTPLSWSPIRWEPSLVVGLGFNWSDTSEHMGADLRRVHVCGVYNYMTEIKELTERTGNWLATITYVLTAKPGQN